MENDPVNKWDPFGEDAWLVSRPIGGGLNHMFVVVADELGGEPKARFSYAPSSILDGNLVSHSASANQDTRTNIDDVASWEALGTDDPGNVSAIRINAPDDLVIEVGQAVDGALGTLDNPGNTDYDMIPHFANDGANSNAAAYRVADTSSVRAGNGNQPLPRGTRNPGWGQSDRVPAQTNQERPEVED